MQLRYDDDFVEAAVFLCASGRRRGVPSLQVRRFHAERERCYTVTDPDERNAAFFRVHLGWFREWGFETLLVTPLREYPLLAEALQLIAFRQARARNEEGAELYVTDASARNAVVALRLERLQHDEPTLRFLRHEFMHLHDMVDPEFAYSPRLGFEAQNLTRQRIVRERYRLLWDITIDGRLAQHDREPLNSREHHQALFNRAFSFLPDERRLRIFEAHWNDPAPHHEKLLALAADPRDLSHAHEPLPGGPCPLCHFPTFDWAELKGLGPRTLTRLQAQFPDWTMDQGACKRCLEMYEVAGKFEAPSTLMW